MPPPPAPPPTVDAARPLVARPHVPPDAGVHGGVSSATVDLPAAAGPPLPACPRCGATVDTGVRFCPRCGSQRIAPPPTPAGPVATIVSRSPWWRRWLPGSHGPDRAARRAWRRSLPLPFRIRRWVIGVLVIAVIGGGLSVIGRNPLGWIAGRWNDLRGTEVEVSDLTAAVQPAAAELAGTPPGAAVDRDLATAWAVTAPAVPSGSDRRQAPCLSTDAVSGGAGALLVNLGSQRRVTTFVTYAGLPAGDQRRLQQPRPRTVQLGYPGGCQNIELTDTAAEQRVSTDFTAESVWITVLDVWPTATADPTQPTSLSEVGFLARP
ncbi:MAG: zinc ribbon domain-containing protein [Nakamurella sp.]